MKGVMKNKMWEHYQTEKQELREDSNYDKIRCVSHSLDPSIAFSLIYICIFFLFY